MSREGTPASLVTAPRSGDPPPPQRQGESGGRANPAPDGDDRRGACDLRSGPGHQEGDALGDDHSHGADAERLPTLLVMRPDHERGVNRNLVDAERGRGREDHQGDSQARPESDQNQGGAGGYRQWPHQGEPAARADQAAEQRRADGRGGGGGRQHQAGGYRSPAEAGRVRGRHALRDRVEGHQPAH
jgi:hypothetical protein